jgi:hypothetical protein
MTDMANCSYSVPSQTELAASGDQLYGPRICSQAFIDWAWDAHDFDKGDWDEGFGWDDCCDITEPLARTFNAIWCLNYSAEDYTNESYGSDILHWGCRYVREHIDELDARCGDGTYVARTQTGGIFVDEWTQLALVFFFERAVCERAGTLVHEARHAGGKGHDAGNNDSSWEYNGAWRWHVCWLAWFAFAGVRTSQAMKTIAKQRANSILATRFTTPPGIAV